MKSYTMQDGSTFIVDDEDWDRVKDLSWCRSGYRGRYVGRRVRDGQTKSTVYLHRFITGAAADIEVDHINGDPLDNRRENLRLASRGQNEQNKPPRPSRTGVRNVHATGKRSVPFRVFLWRRGERIDIGYFRSLEEAAAAAERARSELYSHAFDPLSWKGPDR